MTSTALFKPSFSRSLFLWQNSCMHNAPMTNELTAQLQDDHIVAMSVNPMLRVFRSKGKKKTRIPPQIARTPPTPKPPPMPVNSASRTQGFWCTSLNSVKRILLKASKMPASLGFPPAVFRPEPPGRAFAFCGATGSPLGSIVLSVYTPLVAVDDGYDLGDASSRVSAAMFRQKEKVDKEAFDGKVGRGSVSKVPGHRLVGWGGEIRSRCPGTDPREGSHITGRGLCGASLGHAQRSSRGAEVLSATPKVAVSTRFRVR